MRGEGAFDLLLCKCSVNLKSNLSLELVQVWGYLRADGFGTWDQGIIMLLNYRK